MPAAFVKNMDDMCDQALGQIQKQRYAELLVLELVHDNKIIKKTFVIAIINIGLVVGLQIIHTGLIKAGFLDKPGLYYSVDAADDLYLPEEADKDYILNRGGQVLCNNAIEVKGERKDGYFHIICSGNMEEDTMIEVPLVMYKGYTAVDKISGQELRVDKSENGLVQIWLGKRGQADINVQYTGTMCQKVSGYLSLLTVGIFLFYFIIRLRGCCR